MRRFLRSDVGRIVKWGVPDDHNAAPKWPFYSVGPLTAETQAFDFYFVDGTLGISQQLFLLAARPFCLSEPLFDVRRNPVRQVAFGWRA